MRVALKKMLVFSVKAFSFSGSVEMSVVIGPAAGHREIRGILIKAERLPPSALAGLRDEAGHARYFRIVEVTQANLVAGRCESEGRADASEIVGARKARRGEQHHHQ
jgi:hypothetical protein